MTLLLFNKLTPFISDILNLATTLSCVFLSPGDFITGPCAHQSEIWYSPRKLLFFIRKVASEWSPCGAFYRVHRRVRDRSIHWFRCYFRNFTVYYYGGRSLCLAAIKYLRPDVDRFYHRLRKLSIQSCFTMHHTIVTRKLSLIRTLDRFLLFFSFS